MYFHINTFCIGFGFSTLQRSVDVCVCSCIYSVYLNPPISVHAQLWYCFLYRWCHTLASVLFPCQSTADAWASACPLPTRGESRDVKTWCIFQVTCFIYTTYPRLAQDAQPALKAIPWSWNHPNSYVLSLGINSAFRLALIKGPGREQSFLHLQFTVSWASHRPTRFHKIKNTLRKIDSTV